MTCEAVHQKIESGQPLRDAELAHVADCLPCAELCAESGALGRTLGAARSANGMEQGLESGLWELRRELEREPPARDALKRQGAAVRGAALIALALAVTALELGAWRRPDLGQLPLRRLVGFALLTAPTLAVGAWLHSRPLWRPAPPPWLERTVAVTALAVPLLSAVVGMGHTGHPLALRGQGAQLVPMALGCFAHGACVAALFLGIAVVLDRGGRRASLPVAAALGGLLASWALGLHCPITHTAHQLLGHASVGFVLASLAL